MFERLERSWNLTTTCVGLLFDDKRLLCSSP